MRLMVYSHDSFGLGNIRRILAICKHLLATIPELSILIISGSPMIHSFRLPQRLDYIKLPCLGRDRLGKLAAKYLTTDVAETVRLRSNLIKTAVVNFQPDLLLVDKKPYGLLGELKETLEYLKTILPETKLALLLRDILDSPEVTIKDWQEQGYDRAVQHYYDRVLIVGMPEIFDPIKEYQFPQIVSEKVRFCGYIRKQPAFKSSQQVRQELQIGTEEKLVLVTPGGGEDGYCLVKTYLDSLELLQNGYKVKSLIISGPEMPESERKILLEMTKNYPGAIAKEFTEDLMSYMAASDLVISMGGYNTITEILSLSKKAVVVPRIQPVSEQLIRANKMSELGLFVTIHPRELTSKNLFRAISQQLNSNNLVSPLLLSINLNGLTYIAEEIYQLLFTKNKLSTICNYQKNFYELSLAV
ncbi:glycosyltransferase [Pleurocapsales cyanobacterium LEGE 06147]|nr:glycosyltransferase [Pleurocapsales cyanobacterium LEGE 06147]